MRAGRPFRRAEDGDAADAHARLKAMVAFRSRQFAYENALARWTMLGCAVLVGLVLAAGAAWGESGSGAGMWILGASLVAVCLLPLWTPLTVTVEDAVVSVSLAGVLRRRIPLEDVVGVQTRTYHPLREFGGWGWRWGLTHRHARAYTTTGDTAVVLSLRDGEEVYLGVADESGLERALVSRIGS
jgi:hypothetical protein